MYRITQLTSYSMTSRSFLPNTLKSRAFHRSAGSFPDSKIISPEFYCTTNAKGDIIPHLVVMDTECYRLDCCKKKCNDICSDPKTVKAIGMLSHTGDLQTVREAASHGEISNVDFMGNTYGQYFIGFNDFEFDVPKGMTAEKTKKDLININPKVTKYVNNTEIYNEIDKTIGKMKPTDDITKIKDDNQQ
jgi:hypothetical protein